MGTNGHRLHAWEVEPAPGKPFFIETPNQAIIETVDFDESGWKPDLEQLHRVGAFLSSGENMVVPIDSWLESPVVWRSTTVGMLREATRTAVKGEIWVLDGSTPKLLLFRHRDKDGVEVETPAYDITWEEGQIPPEPDQQFLVSGKYLRDSLMGPRDQIIYLGWPAVLEKAKAPLIVAYADQPLWAAIMEIRV